MANSKFFISKKLLCKVVKFYGGMRKYTQHYCASEYNSVVFHEKCNKYLWMSIVKKIENNNNLEI